MFLGQNLDTGYPDTNTAQLLKNYVPFLTVQSRRRSDELQFQRTVLRILVLQRKKSTRIYSRIGLESRLHSDKLQVQI